MLIMIVKYQCETLYDCVGSYNGGCNNIKRKYSKVNVMIKMVQFIIKIVMLVHTILTK